MADDHELHNVVTRAIAQSLDSSGSPHPTVAVADAVDLVMLETNASPDDRAAIVQQVCEISLKRRYVLTFLDR